MPSGRSDLGVDCPSPGVLSALTAINVQVTHIHHKADFIIRQYAIGIGAAASNECFYIDPFMFFELIRIGLSLMRLSDSRFPNLFLFSPTACCRSSSDIASFSGELP